MTQQPQLIIFITDGNPTLAIGKPFSSSSEVDYYADLAAIRADRMKQNQTRIIGALVGSNVTVSTLTQAQVNDGQGTAFTSSGKFVLSNSGDASGGPQGPSGPDYWQTANFSSLPTMLTSIAQSNC
jgi:hypothetical protein